MPMVDGASSPTLHTPDLTHAQVRLHSLHRRLHRLCCCCCCLWSRQQLALTSVQAVAVFPPEGIPSIEAFALRFSSFKNILVLSGAFLSPANKNPSSSKNP
jgi:hypothetical protein